MNGLDRDLFYAINGWSDAGREFWLFLSKGLNGTEVKIALALLAIALISFRKTRQGGLIAALGWPLANLITDIFKAAIPFPRPTGLIDNVILRVGDSGSMGTASAHSANMMFVAVAFTYHFKWWGAPWMAVAILVGISRIYVGAHFPSQVLFGWLCGAFAALLVIKTVEAAIHLVRARKERQDASVQSPEAQ